MANAISDDFGMVYGHIITRLDSYVREIGNRADRHSDRYSWLNENDEVHKDDFWMHHFLRTRTDIYRKDTAFSDDVRFEIADRTYVYRRSTFQKPEPWARVNNWEKGGDIEIVYPYDEVNYADPSNKEKANRLEKDYADAHLNAVGLITINISLAIRNALDAVHEHRNVT
jgi:hypothetical protein